MSNPNIAKKSFRAHFRNVSSLAGVIGPLVLIITTLVSSFRNVGYDWLSQTVSQLGIGSYGWVENTGFIVMGILSITFAEAIYAGFRPRHSLIAAVTIWILIGFGFLAVGFFAADPSKSGITTIHGYIHDFTSDTIAVLFPLACFLMVPCFVTDVHWGSFVVYTIVTGVIAFLLDSLRIFVPRPILGPWSGIYERIIMLNALIWLELVALRLLPHSRDLDKLMK